MSEFHAPSRDPIELLRALIETPSVNPSLEPGGAGETAIAALCEEWLAAWGFTVETVADDPRRPSVVAHHGAGGPTLLFNGHLDTVGVADMTVPPFTAITERGRMTGRGACDMKGGVAALLAAAADVAASGHEGTLVVALSADEEHASIGMERLVTGGLRADAAIVCEPTSLAVMPAHKGFVWVEVRFTGRAAHGSRPDVGIDAIRHAGGFLAELDRLDEDLRARDPHPLLGFGSIHAGTIAGGTAASVYPEHCTLLLERRTLPGESAKRVMAELDEVAARTRATHAEVALEMEVTLERPGTEVAADHTLVRRLLESARRVGIEPRIEPMTAWVDAAWLNEVGVPAVCFGPGSIAQAHSADEWVPLDEVRGCTTALRDFASRFLASSAAP